MVGRSLAVGASKEGQEIVVAPANSPHLERVDGGELVQPGLEFGRFPKAPEGVEELGGGLLIPKLVYTLNPTGGGTMSRHFAAPDGRYAFTDCPKGMVPFSGLRFLNGLGEELRQNQNNICYVTEALREYFLGEKSLEERPSPGRELAIYQLADRLQVEDPNGGEPIVTTVDGRTIQQLVEALGAKPEPVRLRHVLDFAVQLAAGGREAVGTETLFIVRDKDRDCRSVVVSLKERLRAKPQQWDIPLSLSTMTEADSASDRRIGLMLTLFAYSGQDYFWNQDKRKPGFRLGSYLNRL